MSSHKHMNAHDRIIIENSLNHGESFKSIAKKLSKDCTTISKEVRRNHVERNICGPGRCFNNCIHRSTCQLRVSALPAQTQKEIIVNSVVCVEMSVISS